MFKLNIIGMIISATKTCQNLSDQSQLNKLSASHITIFVIIKSTAKARPNTIKINTSAAEQHPELEL